MPSKSNFILIRAKGLYDPCGSLLVWSVRVSLSCILPIECMGIAHTTRTHSHTHTHTHTHTHPHRNEISRFSVYTYNVLFIRHRGPQTKCQHCICCNKADPE